MSGPDAGEDLARRVHVAADFSAVVGVLLRIGELDGLSPASVELLAGLGEVVHGITLGLQIADEAAAYAELGVGPPPARRPGLGGPAAARLARQVWALYAAAEDRRFGDGTVPDAGR
ncbi:hypothetical protein CcI49_06805 [Frankia sp. CcI49]|uniref:hypothetical protein n=1 Tax=Frankia sp. CcI49 TaxID=1745382 RepID=UPI000978A41D|nr:hypothetical protein [Frankia sp. CcI49]ONH61293.1 hypothetical protein CcI49_06805 [Frankia sp. CcI49]